MKASPSFQFYPADFLIGTALLSNEEKGIYMTLLCYQWSHGHVPADLRQVSRLAACNPKKLPAVLAKFKVDVNGNFFNERLESEKAKQKEYRDKQAGNATKRWNGNTKPDAKSMPPHDSGISQTHALQSSSSSSTSVNTPKPPNPEREALRARLGGWFNRRATTSWSEKEQKALSKLKPETDDVDLLEWFFNLPVPPLKPYEKWQPVHKRRQDLITLLNNWPTEVDKARSQKAIGPVMSTTSTLEPAKPKYEESAP